MKRFIFFLILFVYLDTTAQDSLKISKVIKSRTLLNTKKYQGQPFPQFEIVLEGGKTFSNADILNKITFINFWFEKCPPCVAEMEGFNQMYERLKDSMDFLFVSFTFEPRSVIERFVAKHNIKYNVIQISKDECTRLSLKNGYPASFILERSGFIRYTKFGGPIDKERATQVVLTEIYPVILSLL